MTVSNKKAHPVLVSLQTLLQPDVDPATKDSADIQQAATILTNKVTTSLSVLVNTPSLHSLALEVLANSLVFQFTHQELLSLGTQEEGSLSGQLGLVWKFLDQALSHCPQGWAKVLFKWCVKVLGRFTQVQISPSGVEEAMQKWLGHSMLAPVHSLLNRCTSLLVNSGEVEFCTDTLFSLCATHAPNLSWLLAHVVSQYPSQMMPILLEHTLSYPFPHTLTPSQPIPHSFTTLTQTLTYLSRTHRDILKQTVIDSLIRILNGGFGKSTAGSIRMLLLVATHCPPLTQFVAMDCLEFITSAKIRRLMINGDKATPIKGSHDSHMTEKEDEDEGEILSDEEEMETEDKNEGPPAFRLEEGVGLVSGLLGQLRGKEAVRALNCVMDVYLQTTVFLKTQEEPVEEGEIVHESPLEAVVDGCKQIMSDFLSRLHSSTCFTHLTPQGQSSKKGGAGTELDLVVSLECGLLEWAESFLGHFKQEVDCDICITWLQELLTCVCTCSSELVAGRVLAHLLLNSSTQTQLVQVLEIYWEIHTRHPNLAESAIRTVVASLQHTNHSHKNKSDSAHSDDSVHCNGGSMVTGGGVSKSDEVVYFIRNMLTVLGHIDNGSARNNNIRCAFLSALSDQILAIAQLLTTSLSCNVYPQFLVTIELLRSVLIGRSKSLTNGLAQSEMGVSSQTRCRLVQILLSSFFSLLKTGTRSTLEGGQSDLSVELTLSQCRDLIGWCCSSKSKSSLELSGSVQMLAYSTIMGTVLSEEMSCYFSRTKLSQAHILGPTPSPASHPHLITNSRSLQPSTLYRGKFNSREVRHSGTLNSKQTGYNHRNDGDHVEIAVITNTSHLTQLLLAVNGTDLHSNNQGPASMTSVTIPGLSAGTQSQETRWKGLATVLMDLVAPQSSVELLQWPEEDSLKYSLECDLIIKREFDENPILWHLLLLISEQNGRSQSLLVCASLIRSLLAVLSQHWQRCRSDKVSLFPCELESSVLLIECLAKGGWLPAPLSFIGELFPSVSSQEVHLLLTAVNTFMKENFKQIVNAKHQDFKDTGYKEVIRSTLLNNISKLGHLYPRFLSCVS